MIIRSNASPAIDPYLARLPVIGVDNIVTMDTILSISEDPDFPVTNLANAATYLKWKEGANTGTEYVGCIVNPGSPNRYVDYIAIAGHNFGSAGCTVSVVEVFPTSPYTFSEIVQPVIPSDNSPLIFQFNPIAPAGIAIKIEPGTSPREAAVMYVGSILTFERSMRADANHTPISVGVKTDIVNGFSESGQFLGRIIRNYAFDTTIEFTYLTRDWISNQALPRFRIDVPFFWASAPVDAPTDVSYCWLTKDPRVEFNSPTLRFNLTLDVRGIT